MFYKWKERQLENSATIFSDRKGRKSSTEKKNKELQQKVTRLKDTIAEITTENLALKKRLGNTGER
ncbi:MAG: hypothetical protein QXJ24_05550 [Thermoplasmatales archaeon]